MVIDKVKSQKLKVKSFKTDTFMNNSGSFVLQLTNHYSLSSNDLFIIHDDLDLHLGTWKIQTGKGPKDHGGINDIEQKLGTKVFTRIRVGVDNRKPEPFDYAQDRRPLGEEYVLQDFIKEEREVLDKVIDEICKKLATL